MATYVKGNITYLPVVEQINRKFATRKKTCSRKVAIGPVIKETASWMGGATNVKSRGGLGSVSKNYLVFRENARASVLSQAEMDNQVIFSMVSSSIYALLHDLNQISRIQGLWMQVKDDGSKTVNGISGLGYTFKGWVFAVQFAGRKADPGYDVTSFPQSLD